MIWCNVSGTQKGIPIIPGFITRNISLFQMAFLPCIAPLCCFHIKPIKWKLLCTAKVLWIGNQNVFLSWPWGYARNINIEVYLGHVSCEQNCQRQKCLQFALWKIDLGLSFYKFYTLQRNVHFNGSKLDICEYVYGNIKVLNHQKALECMIYARRFI